MTGGQITFLADSAEIDFNEKNANKNKIKRKASLQLRVLQANKNEVSEHEKWLDFLDQESENGSLWRNLAEK